MEGESVQGDAAQESAPETGSKAAPAELDLRLKLVAGHLLIGVAVLALWAAADAWQAVTGLRAASVLAVLAAIPAGIVFSTLVHEWSHLAGARIAGARYRVPARFGLFVFDYDYRHNSLGQFEIMSYGGQVGSVLAALLIWFALPMDTAGRVMLLSAAIGAGVFGALIEWPVLARTRQSGDALAELGRIDKALLYRNAVFAAGLTLLLWLVGL